MDAGPLRQDHGGEPRAEGLGLGATRYFASDAARDAASPSYALCDEPGASPLAPDRRVIPRFGSREGRACAWVTIEPGTSLYGTGEVAGPLLRNGRRITCWNTDAYAYHAQTPALYQSHPWVLALRRDGSSFGIIADTTHRCEVDCAARTPGEVEFESSGPAFPVIVIEAAGPSGVLQELARLTGRMPMPPRWAIGYHQCRYTYMTSARVREVAQGFRSRGVPCDAIWMDIDAMEQHASFTTNSEHYADAPALHAELLAMGIHPVWMVDPGLSCKPMDPASPAAEGFNEVLRTGDEAKVWVQGVDGRDLVGEVWPGLCRFPDFTSPAVRAWWGAQQPRLTSIGVAGVWNDMNEPALFKTDSKTMPLDARHAGDPMRRVPAGSPQGADRARGDHARYHNVFGMEMARATREGVAAARPNHRPFVLSRANYLGGHRYAAAWTGDNVASVEHLDISIPMALNLGLSGQPFSGPDIGGFVGDGDAALYAEWIALGALLPFSRGHSDKNTRDKEPWAFDDATLRIARDALRRRYRLMPHLVTLFREASERGLPIARPVWFADPADPALRAVERSFLLGDGLLVRRPAEAGAPEDPMPRGVWREFEALPGEAQPTLWVREGAIIPTGQDMDRAGPCESLTLTLVPDGAGRASGRLFEDSGDGPEAPEGDYLDTTFVAEPSARGITLRVSVREGGLARERPLRVVCLTASGPRVAEGRDGQAVEVVM